jgi:hypothetical protein
MDRCEPHGVSVAASAVSAIVLGAGGLELPAGGFSLVFIPTIANPMRSTRANGEFSQA